MNTSTFFQPSQLVRNSFYWSQARLVLAAVALFLGGTPAVIYFFPYSGSLWSLLKVAWLVSGLASAYLGYRWYTGGQRVFGGKDQKDAAAFGVSVVSGLNLGITGLLGTNIGMSISSHSTVFIIVGAVYLAAAWHLHRRFKEKGENLF